jgi:hypothetical protein
MNLTLGNGAVYEDPDETTISAVIQGLAEENEDEAFAILDQDEMTYIQTAIEEDDESDLGYGFVLEYQDGSLEEHYECDDGLLSEDEVIEAFTFYAEGDKRWRTGYTWVKIPIDADETQSEIV